MKSYALTIPQQNIWNLQKFYSDTAVSNLCGAIFYKEKRDSKWMCQAIHQFIKNQSGMRLRFEESDNVTQWVSEEVNVEIPVRVFVSREELDAYAERFAQIPIELTSQKMYCFEIFEVENQSGILCAMSHLIADAWTFGLMVKQVDAIYHEIIDGEIVSNQQVDYEEFIHAEKDYLDSEKYQKDKLYWENKYAARPEISIIKLSSGTNGTIASKRVCRVLPYTLEQKIQSFCNENFVTPAVLFETALIVYLSKLNAENQTITIGIPVLNRNHVREKKIAGMFISTMPLTVEVKSKMGVLELAEKITNGHMELFRHQRYPYANILKSLREKQNFSGNLYDVMVSYQNAKTDTDAETKWYSNGACEIPLEVHIDNRDGDASHTLNVDYQTSIFSEQEIEYLLDRFEYILEQIVEDGCKNLRDISIVPEEELRKIVEEFNDTQVEYVRDECIHELFAEQVKRMPDKVALVFEDKTFTYKELDEMSNSLAHQLRSKGIGRGEIVPIIARRSHLIIIAMLGVLKAGAAYMPIDPTYPKDRVAYMLQEANAKLALIHGYEDALSVPSVKLEAVDYAQNIKCVKNENVPNDLCYIIFTSGSTGKPKGVMLPHRTVSNYAANNNNNNVVHAIIKSEYRSIVSVTNIVFDIFVTESILPLLNGITIYFANEEQCYRQQALAELISKNEVDVIQTTPTKMRSYLLDKSNLAYLKGIKAIVLGGEAFPMDMYEELRSITDAEIFNIYGPAETTVWSTNKKVTSTDITIGRPIANTQIYILDQEQNLLPIGVAGELCIAGDGVGLGYLNRPELTVERFVDNPFATEENHHGKVMYRTGDLARWRADGEIEYLGRIDTQVKIRGLRIELGEIESVMAGFAGVQLVAVTDKKDESGRQYLVGYYTSEKAVDERKLREHLGAKLPKYMVPNYFMHLETMPMTASGKTDRKKLPVPDLSVREEEYVAPVTDREKLMCQLMEDVLDVERIGVLDDFFDMGGDSLRAIEFVAKAHDAGIVLPLQQVFDCSTVRALCEYLDKGIGQSVHYEAADFEKYQKLLSCNMTEETLVQDSMPQKKELGNVLLTGSTGFLGAHVLDCLMQETTGKIYCLVRSGKQDDRRGRLAEILSYYFGGKYEQEMGQRIIPIVGDIEKANLSDEMPKEVQTVIHTAASVKHYGSYEYFHKVNCEGTRHVVNYAKSVDARLIHISTLSVSGNSMADNFQVYRSEEKKHFAENDFYIGQPLDNVYIHSKFEAERVVYDAMLEGLKAHVIRVGNLTNRASDFKFQPNYKENAFLSRGKAMLEFGLFPEYLLPLYSEFSPVDLTAEGIVKLAQYADRQTVFHLYSNRPVYFERFLEIVRELGIPMKVVRGEEFVKALEQTVKNSEQEYIFEAFQNDMDKQGNLVYDSNIQIQNDFTVSFLKKLGFEWNETDVEYIRGYVEYFREIGYLRV